tara:strand:- start:1760 stop:5278 length:3519 start_codon:yes stop_codon:yes gene_type:complete
VLTLAPEWIAAASKPTNKPIFLVHYNPGVANHPGLYLLSGPSQYLDHKQIIADITKVSGKVDIHNSKFEIGEITIELLDDGAARQSFEDREPKNSYVEVKIGFQDLEPDHFAPYFIGTVDDIDVSTYGLISLHCKDRTYGIVNKSIDAGGWICYHPLEAIVGLLKLSGVDDDEIELSEFDPLTAGGGKYQHVRTAPGVDIEKGNKRWDGTKIVVEKELKGPIKGTVRKEIENLAGSVHAAIYVDEFGKIRCRIYDPNAVPVEHITEEDLISFSQDTTYENLSNHLSVTQTSKTIDDDELYEFDENDLECVFTDDASQAAFAEPGKDEFIASTVKRIAHTGHTGASTSAWFGPGHATAYVQDIEDDGLLNLSGVNPQANPGPLGTDYSLTSDYTEENPLYIQIRGDIIKAWNPDDPSVYEYGWTTDGGSNPYNLAAKKVSDLAAPDGTLLGKRCFPRKIVFRNWQTGMFGSRGLAYEDFKYQANGNMVPGFVTAGNQTSTKFSDVTAAVLWAEGYFDRFGHGCPIIDLEVPLKYYHLQVGDAVTVSENKMFYFKNENGLDARTVFEVISKETSATPDGVHIRLKLAFVRRDNLQTLPLVTSGIYSEFANHTKIDIESVVEPHILQGFAVSSLPGLEVNIDIGNLSGGGFSMGLEEPEAFPVYSGQDTYIYVSAKTGLPGGVPVAVGAAPPEPPKYCTFIAKVTSGTDDITGIEDLRTFTPFSGSQIEPGSGPLTHLSSDGSFTGPLDATQISNLPDMSALPALDARVGAIEADFATSGDIPDISGLATNTALSNVQTSLNGTISTVQANLNSLISTNQSDINSNTSLINNVSAVANEALAGSTHGLVGNPDLRLTNANGSPQTWNFWNSSFGTTFDYDNDSFYAQKSVHVYGTTHASSYPVAASFRFPVYHGQMLKCRAIVKPTFAGSRMWGHVYFYRIAPDGTETWTSRAHAWYNADAPSNSWQVFEKSFTVPAADSSWWTSVSNPAPTDQPLVARISWRQVYGWPNNGPTMPDGSPGYGYNSGDYNWRISYLNCHHVGFVEEDLDVEFQNRLNSIESTANGSIQDGVDVIKNSHLDEDIVSAGNLTASCRDRLLPNNTSYSNLVQAVSDNAQNIYDNNTTQAALGELQVSSSDNSSLSGGWNGLVIVCCPEEPLTWSGIGGGGGALGFIAS